MKFESFRCYRMFFKKEDLKNKLFLKNKHRLLTKLNFSNQGEP